MGWSPKCSVMLQTEDVEKQQKNKWIKKEERKLIKNPVSEGNMKIW